MADTALPPAVATPLRATSEPRVFGIPLLFPATGQTLTLKRIWLLLRALFLSQLLATLLNFFIPIDDVFLERGRGRSSLSSTTH